MSEQINSESVSSNAMETIKSNTIIKYDSLSSNRSKFWRLSEQTNLKTPPDNWLCGRFGDYNWSYPLQNHNSSMFSSFRMANSFPECVGSVDVIADSDCIKKLLLMPFDSSHISFMVHRIGNSLLIDEFDLAKHLIRNESKQWSWLKKFIDDTIVLPNCKSLIAQKPITRDELQMKNMLCKFLHYSVDQNQTEESAESEDNLQLSPKKTSKPETNCPNAEENENKEFYFSHYNKESKMSEIIARKLDQIEELSDSQIPGPLRNVLWTFENIRMLVASNMPIFGDSNHPAVSLRLHDMKKPINVLTGLDYWLDNLMSSVPEVVMCYHLDGIVEKYELIKTEEIPEISGKKLFSPNVIRNIAQNILSFLKSKATKAGHTYWLFKGRHDDVVKLYDLTALCADHMEEDSNPFAIPVAMLLYRLAKNMRDANRSKHSKAINDRIHKLLTNCLSLLDHKKHSEIISSANYLLSDVYVPNDIDPTLLPLNYNNNSAEDEDFEDYDSSDSSDDSYCAKLEVNNLSYSHYYKKDKPRKQKQTDNDLNDDNDFDWNTRCDRALKHLIDGLNCLYDSNVHKSEDTHYNTSNSSTEESQQMANPNKPIPLNYSSINQKSADTQNRSESSKELTQLKPQIFPPWKTCLEVCLLQKGAQVFCILAELANSKTNCLKALKYIRLGVMCYEVALTLIEKSGQNNFYKEPIACLLALCGDIHIKILSSSTIDHSNNDNNGSNDLYCNQMIEILEKFSETELSEEFRWAYNPVIISEKDIEQRLQLCFRCYEEALYQLNDINDKNKLKSENALHERLLKRLGYICNELADHYMNESLKHFNQTVNNSSEQKLSETEVNGLDSSTKKSCVYFEKAVDLFRKVGDRENLSLMLSNKGRLMRTCAHIFAPTFRQNNRSKEFSSKEKHFYLKAIECYNLALTELGVKGETQYPSAWHNIIWELCTTLYTVGCLMQEFAPLSTSAFEVIEEEIAKYFTEALNLCQSGQKFDTSRHVLYQYRAATISHRLGSLYHNSYRNLSEESERKKKIYTLADNYYEKSRSMHKVVNDKEEYLRVTLEQIGLHERNLSQLTGFGSKLKAINRILSILLTISDFDLKDIETEEEKLRIQKLLELLELRISFCIKAMIKCLSTKASKHKDLINRWKQMDECVEKIIAFKDISVFKRVDKIFNQFVSSDLIQKSGNQ